MTVLANSVRSELIEVSKLFLRLGLTAFGGPAAHKSMFYDETVERRKWLSSEQFLDLLGATNLRYMLHLSCNDPCDSARLVVYQFRELASS